MTKDEAWPRKVTECIGLARKAKSVAEIADVVQRLVTAGDAYAQAAVDAFKADEWKFLDGPEFDYKKLTAEQEDLYAYAFNAGSKQAWEQAKAEHKSALADTLGMLEALAKRLDTPIELPLKGLRFDIWNGEFIVRQEQEPEILIRAEAEALLGKGQ